MREKDRDPLRVDHMLEACGKVNKFMEGKTITDIQNDEILFYALVKNIEILGEAAFMLTKDFKGLHPEIPWRQIEGMRHVLVHDYYKISPLEVYNVYKNDLPNLILQLQNLQTNL